MNWKASPPALEVAAVALSSACVGAAICFAVARVAPMGAGWTEAGAAGTLAALAGAWLIGRVDRQPSSRTPRMLAPLPAEVLLAEVMPDEASIPREEREVEVLLLDDPVPLRGGARGAAVRATPVDGDMVPPLAGPGEMIARIENFLGHSRGHAAVAAPVVNEEALRDDANAALPRRAGRYSPLAAAGLTIQSASVSASISPRSTRRIAAFSNDDDIGDDMAAEHPLGIGKVCGA